MLKQDKTMSRYSRHDNESYKMRDFSTYFRDTYGEGYTFKNG